MWCTKLPTFSSHTRKLHVIAARTSKWRDLMKEELQNGKEPLRTEEKESDKVCIYRVPTNIRHVEPKAYTPSIVSIGPCHRGAPHLQRMEILKKNLYRRLFDPNGPNGSKLDKAFEVLEKIEGTVRLCYMEEIALERDEFLMMLLIDGSFIIQLLRDSSKQEILDPSYLRGRWMLHLPAIRRGFIMLENQIPFFVLKELFDLTNQDSNKRSLKCLSLEFFYPWLHADSECQLHEESEADPHHFLGLLRSAIVNRHKLKEQVQEQEQAENQHHMIRTATELSEAGVKIKADKNPNRRLLNINFKKRWWMLTRELIIPPLYINDHRGTVLRNIAAFEKCHKRIKPDVTTYLFFFNGLINSAEDVALLHYKGVIHHSLGCDKSVAQLINNITKEMVRDKKESYLHQVVNEANRYCGNMFVRMRAWLVHNYLSGWGVGISTIGAVLALYFTLIQTVYGFKDTMSDWGSNRFGSLLLEALFVTPFKGAPKSVGYKGASSHGSNNCGDTCKEIISLCMEVCITE